MSETNRYSTVAIALHWMLAVLLVSMVAFGNYMDGLREGLMTGESTLQEVQFAYNMHKTTGLFVLVLSLGRLGWRLTHPVPGMPDHMAAWEKFAATATHWLFYVLMIGLPIGGWLAASASPFPTLLFNSSDMVLPKLPVPQDQALADGLGRAHGMGGYFMMLLLALHVAAALKHQFLNKDGLLARMLPFLKG